MNKEYYINKPITFMHLRDSESSEVTDVLLYGTAVYKQTDNKKGLCFVKTDYGYSGYVDIKDCSVQSLPNDAVPYEKYRVAAPVCHMYISTEYRNKPVLSLPRGSIVTGHLENVKNTDFCCISDNEKRLFARLKDLKNENELKSFSNTEKKRQELVKNALSYMGTPYLWGGKSNFGIDCSGLCFMAYTLSGLGLYRDAVFDGRYLKKIPFEALREGDLVYYNGHVVMYIGKGKYVHSSATAGNVCIGSYDRNSPLFNDKLSKGMVCCASSLAFEQTFTEN